jgi:F0F1-type ATP synthase assembly protein I
MKEPRRDRERPRNSAMRFAGLGIEMALPVVLFIYAGHRLDQWLESEPWFMLGGALFGIAVGFYNLFRGLMPPGDGPSGRKD